MTVFWVVLAVAGIAIAWNRVRARRGAAGDHPTHGSGAEAVVQDSDDPDRVWIPPGRPVEVAGIRIPSGLVYVGSGLRALNRLAIEPALIDPSLPINLKSPDHAGQRVGYWPSYTELKPAGRAAYLQWLADGGRNPDAYIGYVFLFFYGLERRFLADRARSEKARGEGVAVVAEVERLLRIYDKNDSFRGYATAFLQLASLDRLGNRLYETMLPPLAREGDDFPLRLRVGLGQLVLEGLPIPVDWALSWILCHPRVSLCTPASRCPAEFRDLFRIRYAERFVNGLVIAPTKGVLTLSYKPASTSFSAAVRATLGRIPEVDDPDGPPAALRELAEECCSELEPYSRALARSDGKDRLGAIALLPDALAARHAGPAAQGLQDWLRETVASGGAVRVETRDLLQHWRSAPEAKLAKKDAVVLAQLLAKLGYGMEPDVRFGGPVCLVPGTVVLFRLLSPAPNAPTPEYLAGTTLLHLAAVVASADGSVTEDEERLLTDHVTRGLQLSDAEEARLAAHLQWLLGAKQDLRGIKKRVETLSPEQKSALGGFLVSVAGADGKIAPTEIGTLEKIYSALGLDPKAVYSHLHGIATTAAEESPVTVRAAEPAAAGAPISAQPTEKQEGFTLDMNRVQAKLRESAAVSSLLAEIFVEEEAPAPPPSAPVPTTGGDAIAGLDAVHSELVRILAGHKTLSRADYEELAAARELLPDGALDRINEAALEVCGEPLAEGDDPLEMNSHAIQELLR